MQSQKLLPIYWNDFVLLFFNETAVPVFAKHSFLYAEGF